MYCLVSEKPLRLAPQGHFLRGVYGTFYLAPQGHFLRAPSGILFATPSITHRLTGKQEMSSVQTGLERFIKTPPKWILGKRLGLLSNPASVDRQLSHARDLININFPGQLKALYSPQHGFFAEKQDNMIESDRKSVV